MMTVNLVGPSCTSSQFSLAAGPALTRLAPILLPWPALECTCCLQRLARPSIIPTVAAVSEPSPGCTLIELDTVHVLRANRVWFAPITWLLPDESVSHVHMKIGVNGSLESGKVSSL